MAATRLGVFGLPWHDLSSNPVVRVVNETAELAENSTRIKGLVRLFNDTLQVAEGYVHVLQTVFQNAVAITKLGVYGVPVAVLTAASAVIKVVTESMQLQEVTPNAKGEIQLANEIVQIAETYVRIGGGAIIKVVTESMQLVDGVVKFLSVVYTTALRFTVRVRKAINFRVRFNEREE